MGIGVWVVLLLAAGGVICWLLHKKNQNEEKNQQLPTDPLASYFVNEDDKL